MSNCFNYKLNNMAWFALHIDRCFETGKYGEGMPRLYFTSNLSDYHLIKSAVYENNILKVVTNQNKEFILSEQPDNKKFEETIYLKWKYNDEHFLKYDDDRIDYEPWAYDSLESLAIELNALKKEGVTLYYNQKFHS